MKKTVKTVLLGVSLGIIVALLISVILYMYAGTWPALVTVTSGSMEPNINQGDLVLVSEPNHIDTYQESNIERFGKPGDVIIFYPGGDKDDTTIIHRAMMEVDSGDNWYKKANPNYFPDDVNNCEDLIECPAPESGYITKGDNTEVYDQATDDTSIVQEKYIFAEAEMTVSKLGYIQIIIPLVIFGIGVIILIKGFKLLLTENDQ